MTKQRIKYIGCRDFNNLPESVKSINNISLFNTSFKKFLLGNLEDLLPWKFWNLDKIIYFHC